MSRIKLNHMAIKLVSIHKLKLILSLLFLFGNASYSQTWTLIQCIDTAQIYNRNLSISRLQSQISDEKRKELIGMMLPKVSISGDYKYFFELPHQLMPLTTFNPLAQEGQFKETQFGVPHNINASLHVSMPILNAQIWSSIYTADLASDLSRLKQKKTEEQVIFDITSLYYNLQILHFQIRYIENNLKNTQSLLQNVELVYSHGMNKKTDVDKIKLQKEQLKTKKELAEATFTQIRKALLFNMGLELDVPLRIDTLIDKKSVQRYESQTGTDVLMAQMQQKLVKSELNNIKYSQLPTLSVYGSYGQTGFGYNEGSVSFLDFYSSSFVGAQLNVPLFSGASNYRKITQKKLEYENTQFQLELIESASLMAQQNAEASYNNNRKIIKDADQQIQLAQDIYNQTILLLQQGVATLNDVLAADNSLREAQQIHLTALIEFLKADLELKKLTGNLVSTK